MKPSFREFSKKLPANIRDNEEGLWVSRLLRVDGATPEDFPVSERAFDLSELQGASRDQDLSGL